MLFRKVVFILVLVFSSIGFAQNDIKKLTLRQIAVRVLESSPDFATAKNNYQVSTLQTKNAFAGFLPSLDLTSSHGPQWYEVNSSNYPTFANTTQLALSETVYDNGETSKQYQISKWQEEQNKLQLQKAKGLVLLNVVQLYYNWCYSYLQNQFTEKYAKEISHQFKMVTEQFYQGVKTHSDYLRFKTQAQRSDLDLINSQKTLQKNSRALAILLDMPNEAVDFALTAKPIRPKFGEKFNLNSSSLIEFKILETKQKISDLQIALIERRAWPQLSLAGSAQYGSSNYNNFGQSWNDNHQTSWNLLLNLKVNFLDWGVRSRNVEIQKLTENSSQQSLRNQLMSAENDLEQFKYDLEQAADVLKISTELEKNEFLNFRQLDKDYHEGRINYLDLITGLSNLLDAQSKKIRNDFDIAILYAKQKYYMGTLDEDSLDK